MSLVTHGDQKYQNSEKLAEVADWPAMSVEHRRFEAGQGNARSDLHGDRDAAVRRRNRPPGRQRRSSKEPCPTGYELSRTRGNEESRLELSDQMECLHLYLPPALLDQRALADFDVDPAKVQIAYVDGLTDQVLFHICAPLRDLLHRPRQPTDSLFVEGIQTALAAHLLGHYTIDRWRPPEKSPSLNPRNSSACWTISRLLSKATYDLRSWQHRPASARFISPDFFARRPDCHRIAM